MSNATKQKIENWMFERALPNWLEHGVDRTHGGFTERLTLGGLPDDPGFKRLRVQARQIYVFSHAALIDPVSARRPQWRAAAAQGFDFLTQNYWLGPEGGWAKTVNPDGSPLDTGADTYDQAFVLFACAWRYRTVRDPRALEIARQTLDFFDRRLACAAHGGYFEGVSENGQVLQGPPRLQNPHMHLMEAMIALNQATGDSGYLKRGAHLFNMFRTRFFDMNTHSLGEYFTREWLPLDGPQGQIVEPGHHFEWSWILHNYARLSGDARAHNVAQMAFEFASKHGVDARSNLTYDEISRNGAKLRPSHRLWPQTEALKAFIATAEHGPSAEARTAARARIAPAVDTIFANYLIPDTGIWNDQIDAEGRKVSEFAPATSLYHLFLAFAETLRFYSENKSS